MGILKNIIGHTSLYKNWQQRKHKKFKAEQELIEQQLLPERKRFYEQFIKANDLVFDVGANAGNRVQVFLAMDAKVIAVEPQPACVEILRNKFGSCISIEQVGLSNEAGELEMHIANDTTVSTFSKEFISNTGNSRFKNFSWNTSIKVPITTMDALIAKYGIPKFCKIDVEGFEVNVLKGLSHKIPYLSYEYCVPEMMDNMLQCMHLLHKLSPEGKFNYSTAESMALALSKWVGYEEMLDIVRTQAFTNTLFGDIYFKS